MLECSVIIWNESEMSSSFCEFGVLLKFVRCALLGGENSLAGVLGGVFFWWNFNLSLVGGFNPFEKY